MADDEIDCACCGQVGRYYARGLLSGCYYRLSGKPSALARFPLRGKHRRAMVLDEWQTLASNPPAGTTTAEIAHRIGMTTHALRKALERARADGDGRAVYLPHPKTGRRYREQQANTGRTGSGR